jgi:hypothetical protein
MEEDDIITMYNDIHKWILNLLITHPAYINYVVGSL